MNDLTFLKTTCVFISKIMYSFFLYFCEQNVQNENNCTDMSIQIIKILSGKVIIENIVLIKCHYGKLVFTNLMEHISNIEGSLE